MLKFKDLKYLWPSVDPYIQTFWLAYIDSAKKITLTDNESSSIEFNFKFYIPQDVIFSKEFFYNTFFTWASIKLSYKDTKDLIITLPEDISFSWVTTWIGVSNTKISPNQYKIGLKNKFTSLDYAYAWEYDFNVFRFNIINENICNGIFVHDADYIHLLFNESHKVQSWSMFVSKYDGTSFSTTIEIPLNSDWYFSMSWQEDGLYNVDKIEIYKSDTKTICKDLFNNDIKYEYDYSLNNNTFIFAGWMIWHYSTFFAKDSYFMLTMNSDLTAMYNFAMQPMLYWFMDPSLLEIFSIDVKSSTWIVIPSLTKDNFSDAESFFKNYDAYVKSVKTCENITIDMKYKDSYYNKELTKKIYLSVWESCTEKELPNYSEFDSDNNTIHSYFVSTDGRFLESWSLDAKFYDKSGNLLNSDTIYESWSINKLKLTKNTFFYGFPEPAFGTGSSTFWVFLNKPSDIWKIEIYQKWKLFKFIKLDDNYYLNLIDVNSNDYKLDKWANSVASIDHYWKVLKLNGLLFARKLNLNYDKEQSWIKLDIDLVNKNNVTSINNDKLFVCDREITTQEQLDDISNLHWCVTLNELKKHNPWIIVSTFKNQIYIYGLKWYVNDDFVSFDVRFVIDFAFKGYLGAW